MRIAALRNRIWLVPVLALACVALAFAPETWNQWLAFDREAILRGEWWRLWTAHLVHFSLHHAVMDALVFLLAGFIVEKRMGSRWIWRTLAWFAPIVSLGLLFWSAALTHYRGLSGIATGIVVMAMIVIGMEHPASRPALALLAGAVILKMIGETFGILPSFGDLPDGVQVEWRAHALGAIGAMLLFSWRNAVQPALSGVRQSAAG